MTRQQIQAIGAAIAELQAQLKALEAALAKEQGT